MCKLLHLLGYDFFKVKDVLTDAYLVRNIFAHGGQLSDIQKKKLVSKHTTIKTLLISLLNYLRISLVIMVTNDREKNEFIDLIDDTLIDRKREAQLNQDISRAKNIVGSS